MLLGEAPPGGRLGVNGAAQMAPSATRVLLAWCVHALTASGAVIGINTMIVGGDLGVAVPSHIVNSLVEETLGHKTNHAA